MLSRPHVALLIKTDSDWHRSIVRGVAQFAETRGGWQFTIPAANLSGEVLLPSDWEGDGVICRLTSETVHEQIIGKNVPAINVSWLSDHLTCPKVVSNERKCALLATEAFVQKQFLHLGYIGFPPWCQYGDTIETTIRETIAPHSIDFHSCPLSNEARDNQGVEENQLATWLKGLPLPIGIIVWSSHVGCLAMQVCKKIGLRVPEDVSILCIEHDNLWSELAPVPLSNLDQDPTRVGFQAGRQLEHLMAGGAPTPEPIMVDPVSVIHRLSTEATAVNDPLLRLAMQYINEHCLDGITVSELVSILGVSRRSLEGKFKRGIKCTPAAYIRNLQLQEVARLLRSTDLSLSEIAKRTGYEYTEVLMRSFKREFEMTPVQFRESGGTRKATVIQDEFYSKSDEIRR